MRVEELLHAAMVADKGRSEPVRVVECGDIVAPRDVEAPGVPAAPTEGEQR